MRERRLDRQSLWVISATEAELAVGGLNRKSVRIISVYAYIPLYLHLQPFRILAVLYLKPKSQFFSRKPTETELTMKNPEL